MNYKRLSELLGTKLYFNPNNYDFNFTFPSIDFIKNNNKLIDELGNIERGEEDVNLYIHIPYCKNNCNYCYFPKAIKQNKNIDEYFSALSNEIEYWASIINGKINNIYIGGGTPTLYLDKLVGVLKLIYNKFTVSSECEFTIETTPSILSQKETDIAAVIREFHINRISIGVQSFDKSILNRMGRGNEAGFIIPSINILNKWVEKEYIDIYNIDIIPGIRDRNIEFELNSILENKVPSITFYNLWTRQDIPFLNNNKPFNYAQFVAEWQFIDDFLTSKEFYRDTWGWYIKKGFPKFKLQNSKYNLGSYIGIGVGAYGFINSKDKDYKLFYFRENSKDKVDDFINNYIISSKSLNIYKYDKKALLIRSLFLGIQKSDGFKIPKEDFKEISNYISYVNNPKEILKVSESEGKIQITVIPEYWILIPGIISKLNEILLEEDISYPSEINMRRVDNDLIERINEPNFNFKRENIESVLDKLFYAHIWHHIWHILNKDIYALVPIYKSFFGNDLMYNWPVYNIGRSQYISSDKKYKIKKPKHLKIIDKVNHSLTVYLFENEISLTEIAYFNNKEEFNKHKFYFNKTNVSNHFENQVSFKVLFKSTGQSLEIDDIQTSIQQFPKENYKKSFEANLKVGNSKSKNFYIYYILQRDLNKIHYVGAIFYSKDRLQQIDITKLYTLSITPLLNLTLREKEFYVNLFAIKSATAAIMARNMSHNLGSHILFYLKTILNHTHKRTGNLLYEIEKSNKGDDILKILEKYKDKIEFVDDNNIKAPFLLGLGGFLNYLQERQDFIATIASAFIPYFDNVNFKDFIYDQLLPDKKQVRHNGQEIKNILLDFIAKSEKYSADNIEVFINGYNGTDKTSKILDKLRQLEVDLPGGTLGRQAFFSIFENFLRNAAKHNEKQEKLVINIDIEKIEKFNNFYKITLYDNVSLYEPLHNIITKAINESYIDEQGKMLKTYKGIKEMRISAAWLRGYNVAEINEQNIGLDNEPNKILDIEDKNGYLAYVFYLYKSKTIAFITNRKKNTDLKIDTFDLDSYLKVKNKNYNIIVIDDAFDEGTIAKIKEISIPRVLIQKYDLVKEIISAKQNPIDISNYFQQKWIEKEFGSRIDFNNKFITIIDTKTCSNNNDKIKSDKIACYAGEELWKKKNSSYKTILFNTHNDTDTIFKKFKIDNPTIFNETLYIEGITGENSTARLIRNVTKDEFWTYSMAESALTKVLILDERLYDFFRSHLKAATEHVFTKKDFAECNDDIDIKKVLSDNNYQRYDLAEPFIKKYLNPKNNKFDKGIYLEDLISALNKDQYEENIKKEILEKKNIELDSIIIKKDTVSIVDLNGKNKYHDFYTQLINPKQTVVNKHKFDFLIIHQGLLDKIFDAHKKNIQFNEDEKKGNEDIFIKEYIFKKIKEYFGVKYRVIIHSGRSEPEYLPGEAIFNQYTSIENALFDCKFTLSQLLYSSRK